MKEIQFELNGNEFLAYWCLSEGSTIFFPRVKALSKVTRQQLKEGREEGIRRLKDREIALNCLIK